MRNKMTAKYWWVDRSVCKSKKKYHLLSSGSKSDCFTLCGFSIERPYYSPSFLLKDFPDSDLDAPPICKKCLKAAGLKDEGEFDILVSESQKEVAKKERDKQREKIKAKVKEGNFEDISNENPLSARKFLYGGTTGGLMAPNPADELIKNITEKQDKLIKSGFDPARAAEIAMQEFDIGHALSLKSLEEDNEENNGEFDDFLDSERFEVRMEKLAENIKGMSVTAKESIEEARIMLKQTFEKWEKDENLDNDFQHFYQICQLKRLIKNMNSLCI